jgi:cytochrome P450
MAFARRSLRRDRDGALEDRAADALAARRSMIDTGPPLHAEFRRLVSMPFAVRSVRDDAGLVQSISRQVLADALARDRFDFVERVAAAVPVKVRRGDARL